MRLSLTTRAHRSDLIPNIVYAAVLLSSLIFIWSNRFLPMQDYPNWVFEGYVFSQHLKGNPIAGYHIRHINVPNAVSTIAMGTLDLIFPVGISSKIFLSLYSILFVLTTRYMLRSLGSDLTNPLTLVPALYLLNDPFFHGYTNYLFGLAFLFASSGYVIGCLRRDKPINPWAVLAFSLVIYFSHAVPFVCLLTLIFISAVLWRDQAKRMVLPILPSLVLIVLYLRAHTAKGLGRRYLLEFQGLRGYVKHKALSAASQISVFHRFYPYFDLDARFLRSLAVVNLLYCIPVIAICLIWLIRYRASYRYERALRLVSFAYLLGFLLAPELIAGVHDPGQRLVYPLLWIVVATFARPGSLRLSCLLKDSPMLRRLPERFLGLFTKTKPCGERIAVTARLGVIALIALQIAYVNSHVARVSGKLESVFEIMRNSLGQDFVVIDESHFDYEGKLIPPSKNIGYLRIPSHAPLGRLRHYLCVEKRMRTQIFCTGLIVDESPVAMLTTRDAIQSMNEFPQQIAIVGDPVGNHYIADLLRDKYIAEIDNKEILILKRYP